MVSGKCNSQEEKSVASFIANEALYYRQDQGCSFKSDPRWVVSPGEEKRPRPATKLLIRVLKKGLTRSKLKLKELYENEKFKNK